MNKKYIIISILVLIVSIGAFFAVRKGLFKKTATENKLEDKARNLTDEQKKVYIEKIQKAEGSLKTIKENNKAGLHESASDIYVYIGQQYYGLGQLENAKKMYLQAIAQNPKAEQAMVGLVIIYQEIGDKPAALLAIEPAINNKTQNADIWLRYIQMRSEEGTAAVNLVSIYNNALDATKRSADLLTSFAQFQEQNGKIQEALLLWQEALKQYPDNEAFKNEIKRLKSK